MKRLAMVAALLAAAATAEAGGVWQRAIDRGAADEANNFYEIAMRNGDEQAEAATQRSASLEVINSEIKRAIAQYRLAAKARPEAAEPYFRIGQLFDKFFFDCNGLDQPITCMLANDGLAGQAVQAWDEFEIRAPLDPRVAGLLNERAILRTKLFTRSDPNPRYLEGAMRDYIAVIDHDDGLSDPQSKLTAWGNLAETYMMLDRLDDAITAYERAVRDGGTISTIYGLAVALDRDDRTTQALELIRDQGAQGAQQFSQELVLHRVFFVPEGEVSYYKALVDEAFGNTGTAIGFWQEFLKSKAHPEYQPRAREHLARLQAQPASNKLDQPSFFEAPLIPPTQYLPAPIPPLPRPQRPTHP